MAQLNEMIAFRASKAERKALEKAAAESGEGIGVWCRKVALLAASKRLRFVTRVALGGKAA